MGSHAWNLLSVAVAGALIATSAGIAAAQTLNFAYIDKSPTKPLLGVAARNAGRMQATSQRAGETSLIVTYRGEPQDFVQCMDGKEDVTRNLVLDLRSTLESQGPRLTTSTVYIVTDASDERVSLVFTTFEEGKAGDLSCRATGRMERKLLGVK
jgi:hypothetical protein